MPTLPQGHGRHRKFCWQASVKLAVVGAGWAGLAAAVRGTQAGHQVSLFEMSHQWGGRARGVEVQGRPLDNGQHILIGAYTRTLDLMATVGVDAGAALHRQALELRYPDGRGLRMPAGPAWLTFGAAVLACKGWDWGARLKLLGHSAVWAARGFKCPSHWTVDELCTKLPAPVRQLLIDPLCVAALNTPAQSASATVFLRVLKDALFSGAGSADLLLPRQSLGSLLPAPAVAWLTQRGSLARAGQRVSTLQQAGRGWLVDGEPFDAVVLACSSAEASRLAQAHAPAWALAAATMAYEPIVTVYLECEGARLPCPMMALVESSDAPAQFAFDHGALGASPGVFAFVVSGARGWVEKGLEATGQAVLVQATRDFGSAVWPTPPRLLRVMAEKRATFSCSPGLARPGPCIAEGLLGAGDYIEGPYPATLEGAVRSGEACIALLSANA